MNVINFTFSIFCVCFLFNICCAENECGKLINYRIPRVIIPEHYDLTLKPDLQLLTFSGEVAISILVINATNEITLHALQLNVSTAKFLSEGGEDETLAQVYYCNKEETVTFRFARLINGRGTLMATFSGILNNQAVGGFYASKYYSGQRLKYSAVTQFEPMNARRAFPCIDEPNMKSTFSVSLIVEKHLTALSNMPQISNTSISDDECKVSFEKTPIMSTYLLCFVVGEYEFLEKRSTNDELQIRVFTPVGEKQKASYALNVADRAVHYFQTYFDVKYPLPKLDLIAINEFDAGAMENWGLITFKEFLLLTNENSSSIPEKQNIARVIVHELAHQWFGNLVTMEWWSQIWLNEGFSDFMHTFITGRLFEDWKFGQKLLIADYSTALFADSLNNSHAIEMQISDPSHLYEVFDSITYSKGASIIRMLLEWIGEINFRRGLTLYFNRFKYSNANTNDLWAAFAEVSNKSVDKVMNTWTRQKGYPYLKVVDDEDCRLTIVQSHFTLNDQSADKTALWEIPVVYGFGDHMNSNLHHILFSRKSQTIAIPKQRQGFAACDVHLNMGAFGFYRTQYTKKMYENLFERVTQQRLGANERFSLLNDLFAFSVANLESTVDYLRLLNKFQDESELFIWQFIEQSLDQLDILISNTDCSHSLNRFVRKLMRNIFDKLNATRNTSDISSTLLYSLIMRRLGLAEDEDVIKQSQQLYENNYRGIKNVDANLKSTVYVVVASNSSDEIFDTFFELYRRNRNDANERRIISAAIGFTNDEKQLQKVLQFSLSKDVGVSDTISIMSSVCHSSFGREKAWNFFVENFNKFRDRYEGGIEVTQLITAISSSYSTLQKANEISTFFKTHHFSGIEATLRNSLEMVHIRANWLQRDAQSICDFLRNQ